MPEEKTATAISPEGAVKKHAKELFDKSISDLRTELIRQGADAPKLSDSQYKEIINGFATKSLSNAKTFYDTWKRLKGSLFPSDD